MYYVAHPVNLYVPGRHILNGASFTCLVCWFTAPFVSTGFRGIQKSGPCFILGISNAHNFDIIWTDDIQCLLLGSEVIIAFVQRVKLMVNNVVIVR